MGIPDDIEYRFNAMSQALKQIIKSEYSAFGSTLIINNITFMTIKDFLIMNLRWDQELEGDWKVLNKNAFSINISLFNNFFYTKYNYIL